MLYTAQCTSLPHCTSISHHLAPCVGSPQRASHHTCTSHRLTPLLGPPPGTSHCGSPPLPHSTSCVLATPRRTLLPHSPSYVLPCAAVCACLFEGGADETLRLWSSSSGDPSASLSVAVAGGGLGPSALAAAADVATAATAARLRPSAACPQQQPLRTYRTKSSPVAALAFSPRNLLLAAGAFQPSRSSRQRGGG